MARRRRKWFAKIARNGRHSGFRKSLTVKGNVRKMLKYASPLRAARRAQALANVTRDRGTKRKARAVARQLFNIHKRRR